MHLAYSKLVQRIDNVAEQSKGVGGQLAEVVGGEVGESFDHLADVVDALVVLQGDLGSFTLK